MNTNKGIKLIGISIILIIIGAIIYSNDHKEKKVDLESKYEFVIEPQNLMDNEYVKIDLTTFTGKKNRGDFFYTAKVNLKNNTSDNISIKFYPKYVNYENASFMFDSSYELTPNEEIEKDLYISSTTLKNKDIDVIALINFDISIYKKEEKNSTLLEKEIKTLKSNYYEQFQKELDDKKIVLNDDKIEIKYMETIPDKNSSFAIEHGADTKQIYVLKLLVKNISKEKEYLWVHNHNIIIDGKEYLVNFNESLESNETKIIEVKFTPETDIKYLKQIKMSFDFYDSGNTYDVIYTTKEFEVDI